MLSPDFAATYDLGMGVWGTAVFSDDLAADTRDTLTDLIADGLTAEEATERLVNESADILSLGQRRFNCFLACSSRYAVEARSIDGQHSR